VGVPIGDGGAVPRRREDLILEERAYRDTWRQEDFLAMMYSRLLLMKDLLSEEGSMYVHLDWHAGHGVKLLLDEIFGADCFRNEIIWAYTGPSAPGLRQFSRKHDTIYWYSKSPEAWTFNRDAVRIPYHATTGAKFESPGTGFKGKAADLSQGKVPEDWWYLPVVSRIRTEITDYPTQKPEVLLERIIRASSSEGSLVADFFCGSGTTCAVAEKLGRSWIGVDWGRHAVHTTRKRLLDIEGVHPFDILSLGSSERRFWQAKTFGPAGETEPPCRAFILRLYGAQPVAGSPRIQGRKGEALVHIGPGEASVSLREVQEALEETKARGMGELHVLAWDWEPGLPEALGRIGEQAGLCLKLRTIPREVLDPQTAARGNLRFLEPARFQIRIEEDQGTLAITLEDFRFPSLDLIPRRVKEGIRKWSDWIDSWALDFDFQSGPFRVAWISFRTKRSRTLSLTASHTYPQAGLYRIYVRIIDIFGQEISQVYEMRVNAG